MSNNKVTCPKCNSLLQFTGGTIDGRICNYLCNTMDCQVSTLVITYKNVLMYKGRMKHE